MSETLIEVLDRVEKCLKIFGYPYDREDNTRRIKIYLKTKPNGREYHAFAHVHHPSRVSLRAPYIIKPEKDWDTAHKTKYWRLVTELSERNRGGVYYRKAKGSLVVNIDSELSASENFTELCLTLRRALSIISELADHLPGDLGGLVE